jgi:MGT family glycosyltransferase
MSRIVFLNSPAYGHVNPTLPVVQELVRRGEQVTYYNAEEFRAVIEQTGATFAAYPQGAMSSAEISAALQGGNLSNIAPLLLRATESFLPFLLSDLPRQQPDLIIFDSLALWGKMAATILKLRAASSISHFVFDMTHLMGEGDYSFRYLRQMLAKLPGAVAVRFRLSRRYRGAYPTERPLMPVRGGLNTLYTSRALQPDTPLIVGPSINPHARHDDDFPFDALAQKPVVYISMGTVHHAQSAFYQTCFAAFSDYPAQFVLSTGRDSDPKTLGDIPANFIARPSVPQLDVLQHSDAFITHGGMNSIHEGLFYGVPLILIPQQLEQLLNARCVEKHGAGIILDQALNQQAITAADLRAALEAVLSQGQYRAGAQTVQETLRATGGYRQAADEIQAYITRGKSG